MLKNIYLKSLGVSAKTIILYSRVILEYLKEHTLTNFRQLVDIVTYDVPGKGLRFSYNYLLLSLSQNMRFVLNSKTDEVTSILTVTNVFASAN
jgi:NADH dehydrogenase (ubiquinone) Fe-S protein 3